MWKKICVIGCIAVSSAIIIHIKNQEFEPKTIYNRQVEENEKIDVCREECNSDDTAAAYSGGAISAGATYEIQAASAVTTTKTDIAQHLIKMSAILDDAGVPNDGKRWIALPVIYAKPVLLNAPEFNTDIERVHESVKEKGLLLRAYGFNLYFRPASWFVGNNATGFYCTGGHTSFITGAYGYIEDIAVITAEKNPLAHSDLVKGLFGHGEKVADERRKCGVTFYAKFN